MQVSHSIMIDRAYVNDLIDYFYEEGNRDLISFGQLIGIVTYDQDDISFGKTSIQRLEDALLLARFLVGTGDFECVVYRQNPDSTFYISPVIGGIEGLDFLTHKKLELGGIDDLELVSGFWLKKLSDNKINTAINSCVYDVFQTAKNKRGKA